MNTVETLMYELMYECMMKVPLFVNFIFWHKWMNLCMKHTLVYFSPFTLYQTYFNWSPICCYFYIYGNLLFWFFFEKYSSV